VRQSRFALALLLLGLTSAVLVARLPSDPDSRIVTRRHHNSDPLLNCTLLQLNVTSLLHHPTRYFEPPILFPDKNPYRSTEPLVAEALLAVPFRLALGARPALVYTSVLITTLALVAVFTGLLLRELGVRASLALTGGCLSVLVATTTIFVDRLQAVSIQWLPLGLLFASLYYRRGGRFRLAALTACAFLTLQASLYTAVMLVAAALFVWPLLVALRAEPQARSRVPALALSLVAAAGLCLLVLWPYLRDREDVKAYATAAYAAQKPWGQAYLAEVAITPPEYGRLGWPFEPLASWDGAYPGAAFVLLLASGLVSALVARVRRGGARPTDEPGSPAFRATKRVLGALLLALAACLVLGARHGGSLARTSADALLWAALGAWCVRLVLWPKGDATTRLQALASAAWLAALVLFLLSMGSPIAISIDHPPLLHGLFGPLSSLLPPLRELRELKRFLLPAGWAAVTAATLSLELRLPARPAALAPALAALVLALGFVERARADTRGIAVPPLPEYYALLQQSHTQGGLLELPFDPWGRINSVKRMLWQPLHGRPIVAGKGGLDPAWYTPAGQVFEQFPSQESVLLLRAWGITSVLDARPDSWREPLPSRLPDGLVLRAEHNLADGSARLFDVVLGAEPLTLAEPITGAGRWQSPDAAAAAPAHRRAVDGSLDTAAAFEGAEAPIFVVSAGATASALVLDYGSGRFSRVPARLKVETLTDGQWTDVTLAETGLRLQARAADQLMRSRRARLVIALRTPTHGPLRLAAAGETWDLPELRLLATEGLQDGVARLPSAGRRFMPSQYPWTRSISSRIRANSAGFTR